MKIKILLFLFCLQLIVQQVRAGDFIIINKNTKATIVYDAKAPAIDSITAHLLAMILKE